MLLCAAAALAGCQMPGRTDLAGGQSLPDNILVKPDEDPETLSEWTRFSRKAKYNLQKAVGLEPNEPIAHQHFERGQQLFREKKFDEAAKEFKSAAKRWPDSPLEEDALFMQGESEFFADRYSAASDTYGRLLKKFENSRHLERAVARQFAIARYWDDLDRVNHRFVLIPNLSDKMQPLFDTPGNAIKAYESVHLYDPTGPLADDSVMAIANVHFLAERYEDADYYYDLLRKQYPQSEHQQLAAQLGLRAKMRTYQGPHYDATPIEEAEELVQQISAQFPNLPPDERERQRNAARALRTQKAQIHWETAEYYARLKYYGGARYYYNLILKEHGDSPFAEPARRRLAEFEGRPDNPPQRFKWLVRIFNWNRDDL
jgi:outer membrane protein assembly factor BamD (BamD/ComL family)